LITNHIPVILLTAKTSIEQRIEGIEQGADSYIPKPFHPEHLQIRVKKLIELRQTLKVKFAEQFSNAEAKPQPIEDKFLAKLTDIIKKNIDEPDLNIEWLSAQMNISRGHLHRKIKLLTEMSPSEFVRIVKLNESLALLKNEEYNISEVSYMVGFNSPSYFTNSFKSHFKMSPTDYVERNKS
jgi:AraC-like DNA-binding protein